MIAQSQFIEMFGNSSENSIMKIKDIASSLFAGGDKDADYSEVKTDLYKYPIIANGVGDAGIIGYSKSCRVNERALTISARGTIGYCAIREAGFTPVVRLITLIPNENVLLVYLKYYFEHTGFESTGAVQGQLTIPSLREKTVTVPPMHRQQQFADIVQQADKSKFDGFKSQFIEMFFSGKYPFRKLDEEIDVIRGVSYKPTDVSDTLSHDCSIVLRSNNIDNGQVNYDDLVYVKSNKVSNLQVLTAGDIVMCGSNGSKQLVGKAAILDKTPMHRTSFGAFCLGIRCKSAIHPKYLATYFQTKLYREVIEFLGSGSNILNIRPEQIKDLEIPIPKMDRQMDFVLIAEQADKSKYLS